MKVAVIADVHSNLTALEAVLRDLRGRNWEIYCLGDLVGYNPFPNEVVELMRDMGIKCLMGNHDLAVVTGNAFGFNPYAARAVAWTRKHLKKENMSFLASLPLYRRNSFYMVHGSPRNYTEEYVTHDYPEAILQNFLGKAERDILALAHTHVSFIRPLGDKMVFNPGSVGQPRDLDPRASYALLDPEKKRVEIRKVEYDVEKVVEAVIRAGLPSILGIRLREGW